VASQRLWARLDAVNINSFGSGSMQLTSTALIRLNAINVTGFGSAYCS
jgi:hypothetical protein